MRTMLVLAAVLAVSVAGQAQQIVPIPPATLPQAAACEVYRAARRPVA